MQRMDILNVLEDIPDSLENPLLSSSFVHISIFALVSSTCMSGLFFSFFTQKSQEDFHFTDRVYLESVNPASHVNSGLWQSLTSA